MKSKRKITKERVNDAQANPDGESYLWDSDLAGFGLRIYPSGKKTYFVQYRFGRRQRRLQLGSHGVLTPDEARRLAKKALGTLAHGKDPVAELDAQNAEITVAELCKLYLENGCPTKKESTLVSDRGRIARHILPLLGTVQVSAVNRADVEKFLKDVATGKTARDVRTKARGRSRVRGGKGVATRTVGLLGGIFTYAQNLGLRPDNPVRGVKRFQDRRLERFLCPDELKRLGQALDAALSDGEQPSAVFAIFLLTLTGCRKSEILRLKWSEVNWQAGCLVLPDSKTGHKIVPLGRPAIGMLGMLAKDGRSERVFPGRGDQEFKGLQKVWERVRVDANLSGVRLHDLRHTFVSAGVSVGIGLQTMGKLVGHKATETTARYAHLAPGVTSQAANQVTELIAEQLAHKF